MPIASTGSDLLFARVIGAIVAAERPALVSIAVPVHA